MAAALVASATSEKLREVDWSKNIEICEFVSNDLRVARDVVKAIAKRLGNKHLNTQLFSVMLLEMLMNNIGDQIYKQVIDTGLLDSLVKIVKKKSNLPVRQRIFLLLDATQTALGGASGKFPQYYNAYYNLASSGVQFPPTPSEPEANSFPTLEETISKERISPRSEEASLKDPPEESIIEKASNSLDVLREVLDALDPHNPEGGTDEFTLDLVEQCSFQKQRVVNLVMTSKSEIIVSQSIELNDKLQKVLQRHEALIFKADGTTPSDHTVSSSNRTSEPEESHHPVTSVSSDEDEEEPEQLYRRMQKGKALANPNDEMIPFESSDKRHDGPVIKRVGAGEAVGGIALPPPPSKHVEREKFFQDKKLVDTSVMSGISICSHTTSSSRGVGAEFTG